MAQQIDSLGFHVWEWVSTRLRSLEKDEFHGVNFAKLCLLSFGLQSQSNHVGSFSLQKGYSSHLSHQTQEFI